MWADVRYALRLLRREPGYAAVAILTMALGIGAATTLFSVAYGVLLKPLPWADADRIVRVSETRKGQPARIKGTITNGSFLAWRAHAETIEAIAGYSLGVFANAMTVQISASTEPVRVQVGRLTPEAFNVLRVRPLRGRAFTVADAPMDSPGVPPNPESIILSYGLWQEWFGGRESAVGTVVHVDELPVTIVGIMPRDFVLPDRDVRAWLPMPVGSVLAPGGVRRIMIFGALARLKPGVTPEQAAAEGTARARSAADPGMAAVAMFGSSAPPDISVTPLAAAMTADVKPAIELLLVAVALLLLTATANVGSLQLARAATRRREIAVRAAIGAGGARLARQLIVESSAVGVAGGIGGVAIAIALQRALLALLPADFPRVNDIAINAPALLFAVAVSLVVSVACGLLPAIDGTRVDLVEALGEDGAASTSGAWHSRSSRIRTMVTAAQIAITCVLLVGAVLLTRSFVGLMRADRGYDPGNMLTARLDLPRRYDGPRRVAFADEVLRRMNGMPGIEHVGAGNALPYLTIGRNFGFSMPSPTDPGVKVQVQVIVRLISPSFFQAMHIRLAEGRLLNDADVLTSPGVLVANRSFVQRYLGTVNPIGMELPMALGESRTGRPTGTIVGVVDDMRQGDVTDPPSPELFASYRQLPSVIANGPLIVVARTSDDPMRHVAALRTAVKEQDPTVAVDSIMTMEERVTTSLAKPRLYAYLLTGFAIAALVIAGVGLFGLLSYSVAQRSREIGVRTALGAQTRDIVALVLKHAIVLVVIGLAAGMWASFAAARYLGSLLYGVGRFDPISYAVVALVVAAAVAIACVVPARRAARVDPLRVLKA